MVGRLVWTGSWLMLFALAGCTALVEADADSLGAAPVACSPGDINLCPCPGGGSGVQHCTAGGSYDACVCDVPAAGAGGSANR